MQYKLYKIKDLTAWQHWCQSLENELKKEALETLTEEGLIFETFINFKIEKDWYSLGLSYPNSLPPSDADINKKHKKIKLLCLEPVENSVAIGYFLFK